MKIVHAAENKYGIRSTWYSVVHNSICKDTSTKKITKLNQHQTKQQWIVVEKVIELELIYNKNLYGNTFALPCLRQLIPNFNPSLVCMILTISGSFDLFFLTFVFFGSSGAFDGSSPSMINAPWVRRGISWLITSEAEVYQNRHSYNVINWILSSQKRAGKINIAQHCDYLICNCKVLQYGRVHYWILNSTFLQDFMNHNSHILQNRWYLQPKLGNCIFQTGKGVEH